MRPPRVANWIPRKGFHFLGCATACFVLALAAHAQNPMGKLVVVERVEIPTLPDFPVFDPIKSDRNGNVYAEFARGPLRGKAIVTEIVNGDAQPVEFKLDSIPDDALDGQRSFAVMTDFSVAASGDLYELIHTGKKTYLVQCSPKGEYEGAVALKTEPALFQGLVSLPGDRFFVTGFTAGEVESQKPVNAIFSGNGELITNIQFAGDVEPPKKGTKSTTQERAEADEVGMGVPDEIAYQIDLGTVLAGQDGNVYVMRSAAPARIFVIGPDGKLARTLVVSSPLAGAFPDTFKVNGDKLAVQFRKKISNQGPDEIIFRVVNATTGARLGDYQAGPETSRWAGYTDDGFVFLGAKDRKTTRVRAIPQ